MTDGKEEFLRCDDCSAPVAPDQRYCVVCGAHQSRTPDPAARYFSEASAARSRVAAAVAARDAAGSRRRLPRISGALATGSVVLALVVGFAIGDSTGGNSAPGSAASAATSATQTRSTQTTADSTTHHRKKSGESYSDQENNLGSAVSVP